MVNKVDAMSQYIVYLRYMGQYLRSALNQILHGSFSIPSYDFSIGLGDDIGQIVRFHPFDFLSVFVPAAFTEYLYEGILLLRFYDATEGGVFVDGKDVVDAIEAVKTGRSGMYSDVPTETIIINGVDVE